jgi:3-hydroxyisobutyrate dehydrogenase
VKAGLIGLGHLGRAIATRLAAEGVDLTVWNRTLTKAEGLNVRLASSPAALVSEVEVLFLNLFDSAAVRDVLSGDDGVFKGVCSEKIIVDTTTNHPEAVLTFHETSSSRGAWYLEAPVIGSVAPALQGNLIMLVSGVQSAFDRALPFIEKICKEVHFLGEPGLSTRMKLINNYVLGTFMVALGDALALAESAGIDKKMALEVLEQGGGNSGVIRVKKENMLKEDFPAHFSVKALLKDLRYVEDLAAQLRRHVALMGADKESYSLAIQAGLGDADFSAVYSALKGRKDRQ